MTKIEFIAIVAVVLTLFVFAAVIAMRVRDVNRKAANTRRRI